MWSHIWFFAAVTRTHHYSRHGNWMAIRDVSTIRSTYSRGPLLSSIALYRFSVYCISHHQWDRPLHLPLLLCVCTCCVCTGCAVCTCGLIGWHMIVCVCVSLLLSVLTNLRGHYPPFPAHNSHLDNNEQVNLCSCAWTKIKMTFSSELRSSTTPLRSIRTNEKHH